MQLYGNKKKKFRFKTLHFTCFLEAQTATFKLHTAKCVYFQQKPCTFKHTKMCLLSTETLHIQTHQHSTQFTHWSDLLLIIIGIDIAIHTAQSVHFRSTFFSISPVAQLKYLSIAHCQEHKHNPFNSHTKFITQATWNDRAKTTFYTVRAEIYSINLSYITKITRFVNCLKNIPKDCVCLQ
jgi:hypothetical protein